MENKKGEQKKPQSGGISVRHLCMILFIAVLAVFSGVYITSINITDRYDDFLKDINSYDVCEKAAQSIINTSNYLAENSRLYVETGNRRYLENYFNEINFEHKREKAMISIKASIGSATAADAERALEKSAEMSKNECYAMKLKAQAEGLEADLSIRGMDKIESDEEDSMLTPEQLKEKAERLLYDEKYLENYTKIRAYTEVYLESLVAQTQQLTVEAEDKFKQGLKVLNALSTILMMIIAILFLSLIFLFIKPLGLFDKAVNEGTAVDCRGAAELRRLAATYNKMHSTSSVEKKKNDELKKSSITDPMTGIYNRNGYEEIKEKLNKERRDAAFILVDVDKFKSINDTYGHPMGDRALCIVADTLSRFFRNNDYIFRLGGDEFAVIMTDARKECADLIKDKIGRINAELGCYQAFDNTLSISAGAAFSSNGLGRELYDAADKQLYESKRGGRRRCSVEI